MGFTKQLRHVSLFLNGAFVKKGYPKSSHGFGDPPFSKTSKWQCFEGISHFRDKLMLEM